MAAAELSPQLACIAVGHFGPIRLWARTGGEDSEDEPRCVATLPRPHAIDARSSGNEVMFANCDSTRNRALLLSAVNPSSAIRVYGLSRTLDAAQTLPVEPLFDIPFCISGTFNGLLATNDFLFVCTALGKIGATTIQRLNLAVAALDLSDATAASEIFDSAHTGLPTVELFSTCLTLFMAETISPEYSENRIDRMALWDGELWFILPNQLLIGRVRLRFPPPLPAEGNECTSGAELVALWRQSGNPEGFAVDYSEPLPSRPLCLVQTSAGLLVGFGDGIVALLERVPIAHAHSIDSRAFLGLCEVRLGGFGDSGRLLAPRGSWSARSFEFD
jgi:hypothetical protein